LKKEGEMKKLSMIVVSMMLTVFLAGNAAAITMDFYSGNSADSVYDDTDAQYVYLTDLTVPVSAPMIEINSTIPLTYKHDYIIGIFDMTGGYSVDLAVLDTYQGITSSSVIFDIPGGTAESLIDSGTMGTSFGFYIQFYEDIGSGSLSSEIYYSDAINDVFHTFYDPAGIGSLSFAEMGLGIGGPTTEGYTLVSVADVAPVPEPMTILFLGLGLLGVGLVRRMN
jgi:hypothetical protein